MTEKQLLSGRASLISQDSFNPLHDLLVAISDSLQPVPAYLVANVDPIPARKKLVSIWRLPCTHIPIYGVFSNVYCLLLLITFDFNPHFMVVYTRSYQSLRIDVINFHGFVSDLLYVILNWMIHRTFRAYCIICVACSLKNVTWCEYLQRLLKYRSNVVQHSLHNSTSVTLHGF